MQIGWFGATLAVVYGTLLMIVIGWLGQRAAKSLRPGQVPGGDTGDWIASVIGTLLGLALAFVAVRRLDVTPTLTPLVLLCGLWMGGFVASLSLRFAARRS